MKIVLALIAGAVAGGPLWLLLARWWLRRRIIHVRRVAASTRQHEHLAELGTLTGGLAHEIKNPLSTIKVNLQLLVEDLESPSLLAPGPLAEQHRRWLRRLKASAEEVTRLQEVLDDFLRFAGKVELHKAPVDLRELVSELADFFAPQAEAAHVRVRLSAGEQPVTIQADKDLLKQALLNLMINAQQAMPNGGELILRIGRTRRRAQVEVIDTGTGMDAETARRIFEAYYTTKRGGTGLGLPTALRVVREHGGQIAVDSTPGTGTRFVISLPLADG